MELKLGDVLRPISGRVSFRYKYNFILNYKKEICSEQEDALIEATSKDKLIAIDISRRRFGANVARKIVEHFEKNKVYYILKIMYDTDEQKSNNLTDSEYFVVEPKEIENKFCIVDMKEKKRDHIAIELDKQFTIDHTIMDKIKDNILLHITKKEFNDLRRLSMYGLKFTVFDMSEDKSKVKITTKSDCHGFWILPSHIVSEIIYQGISYF